MVGKRRKARGKGPNIVGGKGTGKEKSKPNSRGRVTGRKTPQRSPAKNKKTQQQKPRNFNGKAKDLKGGKKLQHAVFPCGPPPQY